MTANSGKRQRRKTMIDEDSRDLLSVHQTDFDADPNLFNCQNGILNLKDSTILKHDP